MKNGYNQNPPQQVYLGDGLYATSESWYIKVHTERDNGTHYVYFDDDTLANLCNFANHHFNQPRTNAEPKEKEDD